MFKTIYYQNAYLKTLAFSRISSLMIVILLALRFLLMIKDLDQDMVLMTRSSLATLRSAWTSDPGSDLGEGWWLTFSDLSFSSRPLSIESVLNVLPSEHSVIFFSLEVKNYV